MASILSLKNDLSRGKENQTRNIFTLYVRGNERWVSEQVVFEWWEDTMLLFWWFFSFHRLFFPFEEEIRTFLWKSGDLKTSQMSYESGG